MNPLPSVAGLKSGIRVPFLLLLARVAQVGISLVSMRILTNMLSSAQVGRLYLLLAIAGLCNLIIVVGPSQYIQREIVEWMHVGKGSVLIFVSFSLHILATIICCAVTTIGVYWSLIEGRTFFTGVVVGGIVFSGLATQTSTLLNLLGYVRASVLASVSVGVLGLFSSIMFVVNISPEAEPWLLGQALGGGIVAGINMYILLQVCRERRLKRENSFQQIFPLRNAWDFIWPIAVMLGLYWSFGGGYRFAANLGVGTQGLGKFVVAYAIGAMMISSLESVVSPWIKPLYYCRVNGTSKLTHKILWRAYAARATALYLPLMTFAILSGPLLLQFLVAQKLLVHPMLAIWGGCAEATRVLAGLIYESGLAQKEPRRMLWPHVIGALFVLVSVAMFSYAIGEHGIGLAITLSYCLLIAGLIYQIDKRFIFKVFNWKLKVSMVTAFSTGLALLLGIFSGGMENPVLAVISCAVAACLLFYGLWRIGRDFNWTLDPFAAAIADSRCIKPAA